MRYRDIYFEPPTPQAGVKGFVELRDTNAEEDQIVAFAAYLHATEPGDECRLRITLEKEGKERQQEFRAAEKRMREDMQQSLSRLIQEFREEADSLLVDLKNKKEQIKLDRMRRQKESHIELLLQTAVLRRACGNCIVNPNRLYRHARLPVRLLIGPRVYVQDLHQAL